MKTGAGSRGPEAGDWGGPSGRVYQIRTAPQARTFPWPLAPDPRPLGLAV